MIQIVSSSGFAGRCAVSESNEIRLLYPDPSLCLDDRERDILMKISEQVGQIQEVSRGAKEAQERAALRQEEAHQEIERLMKLLHSVDVGATKNNGANGRQDAEL